jgi:thiol-disulfide isomerase/thioredoxin
MRLIRFRNAFVALACLLIAAAATAAHAASRFDAKAFETAQAAGRTIVIDVTAPWCPTCRRQRPILESIQKDNPKLLVFEVDFDTSKDVLKRLRVTFFSDLQSRIEERDYISRAKKGSSEDMVPFCL